MSSESMRFSGKPPMGGASRTGSSGVPRLPRGGMLSPPGGAMPPRGGISFPTRRQYYYMKPGMHVGGPYAAFATIDPRVSRENSAAANAWLKQFIPWPTGELELAPFAGPWGNVGDGVEGYVLPGGWTEQCTGCANPLGPPGFYPCHGEPRPYKKVEFSTGGGPVPIDCGYANIYPLFTSGTIWGTDVAVGTTVIVEGEGPSDYPDPWATVTRVSYGPGGGPLPQFKTGTIVLPLQWPEPFGEPWPQPATKMQSSTRYRYRDLEVVEFVVASDGGVGSERPPNAPPRQPPPPGTREQKWKLGKGGPIGDLFGAITEASDALDCAYRAAGGRGQTGFQQKARFASANFDITDGEMVARLVTCMAQQHVSDKVIGLANSKAGRAFGQASGSPRGVGIKRAPAPPVTSSPVSSDGGSNSDDGYGVSTKMTNHVRRN